MNMHKKAPVWLYLFLVLILFVGWLFAQFTQLYDTKESGIALIILLMVFGVTAVVFKVYMREGRHYHNGKHDS